MSVVAGISFGVACFQVTLPCWLARERSDASLSPEVFNFCANPGGVCTEGTACFSQGGAAILHIPLGFNLTTVLSPVS